MKKINLKKGFTLIELLVVVAIIGILASVVLVSLGGARGKGNDAKVQAQLSAMRSQAELYSGAAFTAVSSAQCPIESSTNLFGGANDGLGVLLKEVKDLSVAANTRCAADGKVPSNGGKWAVAAQSAVDTAVVWCVDSTGFFGTTQKAAATAYTLDGATSAINGYICR